MTANAISTSSKIDALLKEFGKKNEIPIRLIRRCGTTNECVAGDKTRNELPTWPIELDESFLLLLECKEFPDHLIDDLITLADHLRNKLNEM
jgi:hypothetical protein